MGAIRWTYKDSLFCHLFGDEARKKNALELYNALSGQALEDPDELELNTIGDAVFLGRKNDVSFLVGDDMVLWEHQSTHNPNMPLRGLLYFARLFTKLIEKDELDIYGPVPLQLPTPRYVVFYFGEAERPEREEMALSDSFAAGAGDVEVTAIVLNCNEGHNAAIMEACKSLRGYARLIALEREGRRNYGLSMREAARAAVDQCIAEGLLADYLIGHRAEVEDMLFTIQDEERAMRVHYKAIEREAREKGHAEGRAEGLAEGLAEGHAEGLAEGLAEGREEGRAKGLAEGRAEGVQQGVKQGIEQGIEQGRNRMLFELVADGSLTAEAAARKLEVPVDHLLEMASEAGFDI